MNDILLPSPQLDLEFPLMEALQKRRTIRKWRDEKLSIQEISDILWCACGETKVATKRSKNRRTVPSACNSQLVSVYAAMESGVYRYDEKEHKLEYVSDSDIRCYLSKQKMLKSPPFGLIYVADYGKNMGIMKASYEQKMFMAATECGSMSQNVYLYCTVAKLTTVIVALYDRDLMKENLMLDDSQEVIYTQIVGKEV